MVKGYIKAMYNALKVKAGLPQNMHVRRSELPACSCTGDISAVIRVKVAKSISRPETSADV